MLCALLPLLCFVWLCCVSLADSCFLLLSLAHTVALLPMKQHMSRLSKRVPKGPPVRTRGLLGQWLSLCYSCNVLQANRSTSISIRKPMFEKHWCTKWVPRVYQMGTTGVPNGYHGCTKWAPQVYQMGTTGAPHGYVRWHRPV